VGIHRAQNFTITSSGISTLWCPSDPTTSTRQNLGDSYYDGPIPFNVFYTNYACMSGPWASWPFTIPDSIPPTQPNSEGVYFNGSATKIADITDGTSNTIAFSEHAHGMLAPSDALWCNHWFAGGHGDTEIDSMYGVNRQRRIRHTYTGTYYTCINGVEAFFGSANSFHPGGANMAMVDG
jgi:prepilin-type processing-associated H-X9-DG protein